MNEHTPTPYAVDTVVSNIPDTDIILGYEVKGMGNPILIATTYDDGEWHDIISPERAQANAAFLVRAANAHDGLVSALTAVKEKMEEDGQDYFVRNGKRINNELYQQVCAALRPAAAEAEAEAQTNESETR